MRIEDQLRDRLRKVEALYFGAATAGERDAAEAAAERLKAKLEEVSLSFGTLIAVCCQATFLNSPAARW
jgi:hypothetical protein